MVVWPQCLELTHSERSQEWEAGGGATDAGSLRGVLGKAEADCWAVGKWRHTGDGWGMAQSRAWAGAPRGQMPELRHRREV